MSSQFLTFIFIILVSVQLSSGFWVFDRYMEKSTQTPIVWNGSEGPQPKTDDFPSDSSDYVSSTTNQITDGSTPTIENSESESSSTANTNTSTTTENILDSNEYEARSLEEIFFPETQEPVRSESLKIHLNENITLSNSTEFSAPSVTYTPNHKNVSSSTDEEKETTSSDQAIERKENHSARDVNSETDSSTPTTENSESESPSTTNTNTPTTTENMLNSTVNVIEAHNVINDTVSSENDSSKSETVNDLDQSASMQGNTTIKTILSASTDTMNTTEMAGSMSNGTTPEVNFGSFVNSGSIGNTFSQSILNLCILIFSISVIV